MKSYGNTLHSRSRNVTFCRIRMAHQDNVASRSNEYQIRYGVGLFNAPGHRRIGSNGGGRNE